MRFFGKNRSRKNDPSDDHSSVSPRELAERLVAESTRLAEEHAEYEAAMSRLGEALRADPGYPEAYFRVALICKTVGQPSRALDYLNKTIELDPDHLEAYYQRALTYMEMNLFGAALKSFEALIRMDGHRQLNVEEDVNRRVKKLKLAIQIDRASAETKIIPQEFQEE